MKIAISVESTSDLSKELLAENDIKVIPFHIVLGSETFSDGERTVEELFEFVDKNGVLPKPMRLTNLNIPNILKILKKNTMQLFISACQAVCLHLAVMLSAHLKMSRTFSL